MKRTKYCEWRDLHNAAEKIRIIGETLCGYEDNPASKTWFHLLKLAAQELQKKADLVYPEIESQLRQSGSSSVCNQLISPPQGLRG